MSEFLKFGRKHTNQEELQAARFVSILIPLQIDPTDTRWHVNHIWVDKLNAAVSTDGCRLHKASPLTYKGVSVRTGWYSVVKCSKTMVWLEPCGDEDRFNSFPDYDSIIAGPGRRAEHSLTCHLQEINMSSIYAEIIRAMDVTYINYRYLLDLCEFEVSACIEIWKTNGQTDLPLRFQIRTEGEGLLTAMVMPIRGGRD